MKTPPTRTAAKPSLPKTTIQVKQKQTTKPEEEVLTQKTESEGQKKEVFIKPTNVFAQPSALANALCENSPPEDFPISFLSDFNHVFSQPPSAQTPTDITVFRFDSPSPDDIILQKQSQGFKQKKGKTKTKKESNFL